MAGGGGGGAVIVTCSRVQETLRVEPCVELELSLRESYLEPSLLIWKFSDEWTKQALRSRERKTLDFIKLKKCFYHT